MIHIMSLEKGGYKVVNLIPRENIDLERSILEKNGCTLVQGSGRTTKEVIESAKDAYAVIASEQPFTREVFETLNNLRMVSIIGVGFDTVDIKAATDNGVLVTHVPDLITDQVADHAVALILSLIRRIPQADKMVKSGIWESRMNKWAKPVPRIRGLTAGIIGFGRTGRATAQRLRAFGFNIIAYDPFVKPETVSDVDMKNSLTELLKQSDIVSIHVALSADTKHLIGERELRAMKKTAFLVNVSRGPIIDEPMLCRALSEGWIAGAALDVLEVEPPKPENPILKLENVILTPHIAYYSDESVIEQRKRTVEEIIRHIKGLPPLHAVNPEVKLRK